MNSFSNKVVIGFVALVLVSGLGFAAKKLDLDVNVGALFSEVAGGLGNAAALVVGLGILVVVAYFIGSIVMSAYEWKRNNDAKAALAEYNKTREVELEAEREKKELELQEIKLRREQLDEYRKGVTTSEWLAYVDAHASDEVAQGMRNLPGGVKEKGGKLG